MTPVDPRGWDVMGMTRLLAEELLLLCWDDEKGTLHPRCSMAVGPGIGGALVIDAVLAEALAITDDRVQVTGTDPGDPMLAEVVAAADRRRPPSVAKLVQRVGTTSRYKAVRDRLVGQGVLRADPRRMLGIIPHTRYPSADPAATEAVRETVRTLLTGRLDPIGADPRVTVLAGLAGLAVPIGAADVLVARGQRTKARRRVEALADLHVRAAAGQPVQEQQIAAIAAVTGAVTAGTAGTASGAGSVLGSSTIPRRARGGRGDPGAGDGAASVEESVEESDADADAYPAPVEEVGGAGRDRDGGLEADPDGGEVAMGMPAADVAGGGRRAQPSGDDGCQVPINVRRAGAIPL